MDTKITTSMIKFLWYLLLRTLKKCFEWILDLRRSGEICKHNFFKLNMNSVFLKKYIGTLNITVYNCDTNNILRLFSSYFPDFFNTLMLIYLQIHFRYILKFNYKLYKTDQLSL